MLVCDVREEQPLEPSILPLGDCFTSFLCSRLYAPPWGPPQNSVQSRQPSGAEWRLRDQLSTLWATRGSLPLEEEFSVRPCRRRLSRQPRPTWTTTQTARGVLARGPEKGH